MSSKDYNKYVQNGMHSCKKSRYCI